MVDLYITVTRVKTLTGKIFWEKYDIPAKN